MAEVKFSVHDSEGNEIEMKCSCGKDAVYFLCGKESYAYYCEDCVDNPPVIE